MTLEYGWMGAAGVGALCVMLALSLPGRLVPYSGFVFALLGAWFRLLHSQRNKTTPPMTR